MRVIVGTALIFGVAQNVLYPAEDPRDAYLRAAKVLESGPSQQAVGALQNLVQQHAATFYAELAAFHLAECHVILGQPQRAIRLLEQWKDRLSLPDSKSTAALPDLTTRVRAVHTAAARASAVECECQNDFAQALRLLEQGLQSAEAKQAELIDQEIRRVAVVGCLHQLEQSDNEPSLLSQIDAARQVPVRFCLAERLLQDGRLKAATQQLDWLSVKAVEQSEDERPSWAITVALRRCEIAVQLKQYEVASEMLDECKLQYSQTDRSHFFEFLLARCAIAQIEFDTAIDALRAIGERESLAEPQRARAYWMIGEVHFLKQGFAAAIDSYQRAYTLGDDQWQSRAMLQMAKCQELTGQTANAMKSYEQLRKQFANTAGAEQATVRLAQLRNLPEVQKETTRAK